MALSEDLQSLINEVSTLLPSPRGNPTKSPRGDPSPPTNKPPPLAIEELSHSRSKSRKSDKRLKSKNVKKNEGEEEAAERTRSSSGGSRQRKSPRKNSPNSHFPVPSPPKVETAQHPTVINLPRSKSTTRTGVKKEIVKQETPTTANDEFSYRPGIPFNFPSMPPIPQTPALKLEPEMLVRKNLEFKSPATPQEVRRIFDERV